MKFKANSIRAFIGAKDFNTSRAFYSYLGFEEVILDSKMSYFKVNEKLGFYLQNYYVKDWVENTMLFLEVESLEDCLKSLLSKKLSEKYEGVKLSEIKHEDWGKEFFMHDPCGNLWHFGEFN